MARAASRVGVVSYSRVIDQYLYQRNRIGHLDLVKRSLIVPDENDLIRCIYAHIYKYELTDCEEPQVYV